ncbi:uncharacterized protein N7483_005361 [Penicillium malachiteum]|uniref:uncharacterized protein n=1 Tax=Penicillium malachiteum TaxID=1324776 RepID=UPI002549042B|nr:uncharacterized protein N7483_005361 [Penicillium malachiteum]KAJ5730853.1 hypothetical protein N7483_005361 [Penicillium malachiteum]
MWILESTGDFLGGKRVWLRPGKKYLLGRPEKNINSGLHRAIPSNVGNGASVSRKHLTIEVSSVTPRDGTHVRARTKVTVTDLNSKKGTTVDGEQIRGQERVLSEDETNIQLGRSASLRLKWEPVVLSFSFSSKELRSDDPLAKVRSKLEDLDIKTIIPYLVDQTTHVVQNKRNTAKGLQALINGKPIVSNAYIDALVYATTPTEFENDEALSPLETDFDAAWPNPTEYLPPAGKEPVDRPASVFGPDPARFHIFEGYTFVFGEPSQFENLQAAINNGQGKALLYPVKAGATTAEEIVQFMREAGGQKGTRARHEELGKVVLVRFRLNGENEQWSIEISNQVAWITDRRVIEQSEFLGAILGSDASPLCRSLPSEERSSQTLVAATPGPSQEQVDVEDHSGPSQSQPSPVQEQQVSTSKTKTTRLRKFVSKMKTFDDGFDMESIPVYSAEEETSNDTQQPGTQSVDDVRQPSQTTQPLDELEDADDDIVQSLLPGAKAMKRRREEIDQGRKGSHASHTEATVVPKAKRAKLNIMEAARKHREEEEQQRKAEDEAFPSQDVNVEELKNLAIVEEMEMPVRERPAREEDESSDRWDDRWNGRKNFKKFRRKGEPLHARQRIQSVIVPLEEVTRKDFGVGEHYWVTSRKSPVGDVVLVDEQENETTVARAHDDDAVIQVGSQPSLDLSASPEPTPEPTPEPQPVPSRSRTQKRPLEVRDSDSDDEELRFRFRRKR